jgi:hypothetical protein
MITFLDLLLVLLSVELLLKAIFCKGNRKGNQCSDQHIPFVKLYTVRIRISGNKLNRLENLIEKTCLEHELTLRLKSALSKYPNSVHWHFKNGKQRGTLEITFWKEERRLWFSVQSKRNASWIPKMIRKLKSELESP